MAVDIQNTSFSDIDLTFVKDYLHIESEFTEDDVMVALLVESVKAYILKQTGKTIEQLDLEKQVNIIYLLLISESYQNRSYTVDKSSVNPMYNLMLDSLMEIAL